ncbi:hypothetical protein D3C86_1689690 [compost metagenome]
MGADPGQQAQHDDDQQRRAPDHEFELGGMIPIGFIFGFGVALAILPRKEQGQCDDWDDNQQHQQGGHHHKAGLLRGDIAGRVHYHGVAACEQQQWQKSQSTMVQGRFHAVMYVT